ncbi:hypothetical protein M7I_0360 [Glarea lozoyensis 74030]|uniref:Uncharacterized protein n=1 Tax=Glarea lozoyensis (strain ATCC 74030 / MF5533) TaxID=1104152 RepID=H0ED59_GLAL7|nr:hypothetical protein M7I_0360 [Glarea lozoyensis 74030]
MSLLSPCTQLEIFSLRFQYSRFLDLPGHPQHLCRQHKIMWDDQ